MNISLDGAMSYTASNSLHLPEAGLGVEMRFGAAQDQSHLRIGLNEGADGIFTLRRRAGAGFTWCVGLALLRLLVRLPRRAKAAAGPAGR